MKFIKEHVYPVVVLCLSKIRKWHLRLRGKDPDLWKKIDRLHIECEGHKTKIKKLEQQIASMENEFEEFKAHYLKYLQSSSDWQSKRDARSVFLAYLESAIPISDEEMITIQKEHKVVAEAKGIRALFSFLTEKKKL